MIFVFGSNLNGIHGAGAALYAKKHHGAVQGVGRGRTGNAYALPTKDRDMKSMDLKSIQKFCQEFVEYVKNNPQETFALTPVGTGLAGYSVRDIANVFRRIGLPNNVYLTSSWLD